VLSERPEPSPGEREVLIQMRAASLNFRDIRMVEGSYNPRMRLPLVPLSDGAGEVVKTGTGVQRLRVRDRVAPAFFPEWLSGAIDEKGARSALGGGTDGVASEYVVTHEDAVVRLPDYLSYEEAAALPAAVTAWNALHRPADRAGADCTHVGKRRRVLLCGTVRIVARHACSQPQAAIKVRRLRELSL
ncbi:MAG: alcohol dehydrogenase catalytic domain-containing protein, partial [Bryobacteraceae bacterium]